MAFLDNSGDIILDAVLTDTGRMRLAKGDGSFKIAKFALGDDEIDYTNYNKNHASGSAYYDLEVLQTPVLEAFTNNASSMKSLLLSIPRTNLLYLPILKINENFEQSTKMSATDVPSSFVVAVDNDTEDNTKIGRRQGVMFGENPGNGGSYIRIDQGLDTTEISAEFAIDADLIETQYIIEIDNRLGYIVERGTGRRARVSYIDDDYIASYYLTLNTDPQFVKENTDRSNTTSAQIISGPRGTILEFKIKASVDLNSSTYYFTTLGTTMTFNTVANVKYIDSQVTVTGGTTGYRITIPVRFIKVP